MTAKTDDTVNALAEKAGLSKERSRDVLNALGAIAKDRLAAGEPVKLPGIGTLELAERAARTGRNPRTGKDVPIAARRFGKLKIAAELRKL